MLYDFDGNGPGDGAGNGNGNGNGRKVSRHRKPRQQRSRMEAPLGTPRLAIRFVNGRAMEEKAYEHVFGEYILPAVQRALMFLIASEAKHKSHPPQGQMVLLLQQANDCCDKTAIRDLKRAYDQRLVETEPEGTSLHYFIAPETFPMVQHLARLLAIIPEIVNAQVAAPDNPDAGIDLLSEEDAPVYYNIVRQF